MEDTKPKETEIKPEDIQEVILHEKQQPMRQDFLEVGSIKMVSSEHDIFVLANLLLELLKQESFQKLLALDRLDKLRLSGGAEYC